MVGSKMLEGLEQRGFPVSELVPVASEKSKGKEVIFKGKAYHVVTPAEAVAMKPTLALFSAGGSVSLEWAPKFAEAGTVVVDNSSAWRMDPTKKLVIPEINADAITANDKIIANPNCSTIQAMLPLEVIKKHYGLKRVIYTTYQAVSGAGSKGINELRATLKGEKPSFFPYNISASCIPHVDAFADDDYTKEELKMVNETRKILHLPHLPVTATCVRVPIETGHSVAIIAETERPFEIETVKKQIGEFPGIILHNDVAHHIYPVAEQAQGRNEVFVGRIRHDFSQPNSLHIWCVADNVRKGAATNAVQIVEQIQAPQPPKGA